MPSYVEADIRSIRMHLVTSSLFLPSLVANLKKTSSHLALLRAYFSTTLAIWVRHDRPHLRLSSFYQGTSTDIVPPERKGPISQETFGVTTPTPNPWLPLLQSTLGHPDDHVPKIQRAFAHYAVVYGGRRAGYFSEALKDADEKLEGLDALEGTLFVRAAGLTMDRVGWVYEGGENGGWDF